MKKITYLLGAGASANACPILNKQGIKMVELATKYLPGSATTLMSFGKYFSIAFNVVLPILSILSCLTSS